MAYKVLTDGAGSRLVRIVGMGDYMPAQMYSELESKNAELRTKVEFMARAINNAYDFIPAGALGIKSDLKQAVNYPHQTTICYQCERPALVLNKNSRCITCVTENFEKTEAEFELALEGQHPVQLEVQGDIFKKVNSFAKELQFEFEHAVQVNRVQKVVTAGMNILHAEAEAPLFLSVDELRRLAAESLKLTEKFIAKSVKGDPNG